MKKIIITGKSNIESIKGIKNKKSIYDGYIKKRVYFKKNKLNLLRKYMEIVILNINNYM